MSDDNDKDSSRKGRRGPRPFKWNLRSDQRKETAAEVDETLDRMVSQIGDRTPEYSRRARSFIKDAGRKLKDLDEEAGEYTDRVFKSKPLDFVMTGILKWKKVVFTLTVIISLLIGYFGVIGANFQQEDELYMQSKIEGSFEVYLPGGSDAEKVLSEMEKDWSTDLATLFVETQNKFDPTDETNITDYEVLKEISEVEEQLNYNKTDRGDDDGIVFTFSISILIKTLHNATNAFEEAFLNELPGDLLQGSLPEELKGNYSIPEDQRLIDEFFNSIGPETISSLVADINEDGIYDSALIIMGLSNNVDQDELLAVIEDQIEPFFVDPGVRPGSEDTTDEWMVRYENGEVHCRMTMTGPTPLAKMISDRTMKEMQKVLPWALAMVAASLLIFHRTWKILIITLVPVTFSLIIAFGMMGLFLPVLTPQVVLVAPILIALGVAYGLYIANRYAEESNIEDREKRIRYALRTTGKAIFLSAMTTAFGFGAMLTVDMATMQVLGFGLAAGILACYATTMLMTPSLVLWLNYKKLSRSEEGKGSRVRRSGPRRLGNIPMRHSRKILAGGILLAIISMGLSPVSKVPMTDLEVGGFGLVQANMDYISISPADEPVVQKMSEQSDTFGSGQIELFLIRGEAAEDVKPEGGDGRDDRIEKSMKDYDLLVQLDRIMMGVNGNGTEDNQGVENAYGISIVDIMKMIKIPDFTNNDFYLAFLETLKEYLELNPFPQLDDPVDAFDDWVKENVVNQSYWSAMTNVPDNPLVTAYLGEDLEVFIMNIFYNSMGIEIRGMLVNEDFSKTIVYISMPNMDIVETEKTVNQIDEVISSHVETTPSEKGAKPTASETSGFGKVLVTVNEVIVDNANQSTIMALIMVFLLLFIVFRDWRIALITIFPVSLVVMWQYFAIWGVGEMGGLFAGGGDIFSGDLNLFTALIGSIIIGIGVDFSIHITERVREKNFTLEGVMYAADTSGWSFIESSVTMIMGLTAVFLVNIPSIREFILLIMILLAFSAYAAIFILTSAYRVYLPRYNKVMEKKRR